MPKLIHERWEGAQTTITREQAQKANPDGSPMVNGEGQPEMVDLWVLTFILDIPGERNIVQIPFEKEGRDALVSALSGGVVVASQLPPHLPFGKGV